MALTTNKKERDFFDDIEEMIREEQELMRKCDCGRMAILTEVPRGKDILYLCPQCLETKAPYLRPTPPRTGKRIGNVFIPD